VRVCGRPGIFAGVTLIRGSSARINRGKPKLNKLILTGFLHNLFPFFYFNIYTFVCYEAKGERTKGQGFSNWMVNGRNFFHKAWMGTPSGSQEPGRYQGMIELEGAVVK